MTGIITVKKSEYPGEGEALIYLALENDFKDNPCFKALEAITKGKLSAKMKQFDFSGKEGQMITLESDNAYKLIIVIGVGEKKYFNRIIWRNQLFEALKKAQSYKLTSVTVSFFKELGTNFLEIGKQAAIAFHLSNYNFDVFKSEDERKKINRLKNLEIIINKDEEKHINQIKRGVEYGGLLTKGIYLTRNLVNNPGSHVGPVSLEEEAFRIEKASKGAIKVEVLDEDECRRHGMGVFLAVAQGSDKKPKFIILRYKDKKKIALANKCICLIGKSITFDSGGLSLKPSDFMETMKMDMAGGAAVLGVFEILSQLSNYRDIAVNGEIIGILPACENMPSGNALRPGDVVTACNKKTIEVLNTDAEGRLTLADAISYAEEYIKPDMIIDIATLTGACMAALGRDITGMFGNDKQFNAVIEKSALNEGEELWQLPLHKPYAKQLKSDIADLKNIGGGRYGGAITAALFLAEFVKKAKWIHLDIAGSAFNEGSPQGMMPKGGTGWGVLTLMNYLLAP